MWKKIIVCKFLWENSKIKQFWSICWSERNFCLKSQLISLISYKIICFALYFYLWPLTLSNIVKNQCVWQFRTFFIWLTSLYLPQKIFHNALKLCHNFALTFLHKMTDFFIFGPQYGLTAYIEPKLSIFRGVTVWA